MHQCRDAYLSSGLKVGSVLIVAEGGARPRAVVTVLCCPGGTDPTWWSPTSPGLQAIHGATTYSCKPR